MVEPIDTRGSAGNAAAVVITILGTCFIDLFSVQLSATIIGLHVTAWRSFETGQNFHKADWVAVAREPHWVALSGENLRELS
jgi:hypothetical protein